MIILPPKPILETMLTSNVRLHHMKELLADVLAYIKVAYITLHHNKNESANCSVEDSERVKLQTSAAH